MKSLKTTTCLFLLAATASPAAAQVGSVLRFRHIGPGDAGFVGPLDREDMFGISMAAMGDLNGDGVGDLAVGAVGDSNGGRYRGAVWILFLAPDGTVRWEQKISQTQGGFAGTLVDSGYFGRRVACVGDLDGDGRSELAVVANFPFDRLWILFLNADGTVRAQKENDYGTSPVFVPSVLPDEFRFGGLAALGDLDGDGLGDLAVGAPEDSDGAHEAGSIWILRLAADGSLRAGHKISQTHGGFTGVLDEDTYFGQEIVQLGDLDGDGNRDLLVKTGYFDDRVWILHLDDAERVVAQQERRYGLSWPGPFYFQTATTTAWLGDVDGDGVGDLALGWPYRNWPGGFRDEGGIAIGFLAPDASVRKHVRISSDRGGMKELPQRSWFGSSFAPLGDLDGDGALELAVGASGVQRGYGPGMWILTLDPSATRNGTGVNPMILTQASEPVFGATWSATLDCSGHSGGLAVLRGYTRPTYAVFTPIGELLTAGERLFSVSVVNTRNPARFSLPMPAYDPYDLSLVDLPVFVQGLCTGAPARFSNALDVVIGH